MKVAFLWIMLGIALISLLCGGVTFMVTSDPYYIECRDRDRVEAAMEQQLSIGDAYMWHLQYEHDRKSCLLAAFGA